jgi:hypothetical protein
LGRGYCSGSHIIAETRGWSHSGWSFDELSNIQ